MSALPDPRRHVLPADEHDRVLRGIRRLVVAGPASASPTLTVLGGLPGSGKSTLARMLLAGRDAALISADSLSEFHPHWPRLLREDDSTAGSYVRDDAVRWVEEALHHARELRRDVLFDTALADPDRARSMLTRFRDAGYTIDVVLVAAPAAMSELGVLHRYLTDRGLRGGARFVDNPSSLFPGILMSVRTVLDERLAHTIAVYTRESNAFVFRTALGPAGRWTAPANADAAFAEACEQPWDLATSTWFAGTAERLARARPEELGPGLQPRWSGLLSRAVQTAQPCAHPDTAARLKALAGQPVAYGSTRESAEGARRVARQFQAWSRTPMGTELMDSGHPVLAAFRDAWRALPSGNDQSVGAAAYRAVGRRAADLQHAAARSGRFSDSDLGALARVRDASAVHARRLKATYGAPRPRTRSGQQHVTSDRRIQPPPSGRRGPSRGT